VIWITSLRREIVYRFYIENRLSRLQIVDSKKLINDTDLMGALVLYPISTSIALVLGSRASSASSVSDSENNMLNN
jgi:hypothetical protein